MTPDPLLILDREGYRIKRVWLDGHEITRMVRRIEIVHDATDAPTFRIDVYGLVSIRDIPDAEDEE